MFKQALVLGAGMVSGPCIGYLIQNQCKVTVVSASREDIKNTEGRFPSASVLLLDIASEANKLHDIVVKHDVVISLLPDHLHLLVTTCCIDCKKNFVHVSFEGDDIRRLNQRAVDAGITILSEVGLDPGINHVMAMSCIDSIKHQGGKVTSFVSLCGGLPAPECSTGPLRYKFSWYPKGMLMSVVTPARFIKDGKLIEVPGGQSFDKPDVVRGLLEDHELEYVPNEDAARYKDIYGISSAGTVYTGTLRYKGFCSGIKALLDLGLFSSDSLSCLLPESPRITWRQLICILLKLQQDSCLDKIESFLKVTFGHNESQLDLMVSLGILSNEEVPQLGTPIDALSSLFSRKLAYAAGERDMVVLRNVIEATLPDGRKQQHTYDLVEMGQAQGDSAMATTVGLTVAICACLLMEGAITRKGAILPVTSDIYQPVLDRLAKEGIAFKSVVTQLS
ncbi:hypothetical protein BsWGS_04667 [Bradybaena similaris]